MRRMFLMGLVLLLTVFFIAGCAETPEEELEEPVVVEGFSSLGLGVVTSVARSLDYDEESDVLALGQVDNVIAVAAFDDDGRVAAVIIDTAQTRVSFDQDMQVASDLNAEIKTKVELGADYGMIRASGIGVEWDEQIAALEAWMIGKTLDQIKALDLTDSGAPDDPDLVTSVTITVTDYIAALEKAYANAVAAQPGGTSLGLGHNISIGRSLGYTVANDTEILPVAQVDVVIAAALFDDAGQVAGVVIDTAQTRVNFDADGKVTSDRTAAYPTKKELGADYGMIRASGIGVEWDEQIAALEEWMIGKTIDQINALALQESGAPDDPDLVTSVTITVTDYLSALQEAYNRAR